MSSFSYIGTYINVKSCTNLCTYFDTCWSLEQMSLCMINNEVQAYIHLLLPFVRTPPLHNDSIPISIGKIITILYSKCRKNLNLEK